MATTAFPSGTDATSTVIPDTGANLDVFLGATSGAGTHPAHHQLLASATEALEDSLRGGWDGIWDVRGFGAACDGVSDDAAEIQEAIEACSLEGGGIVWVPQTAAIASTVYIRPGVFLKVPGHTIGTSQVGSSLATTVDDYNTTTFDWWDDPYQNGLVWIGPNGGGPMVMMQPDIDSTFDPIANTTESGVGKGVPLTHVGFSGQLIAGTDPAVSAADYGIWICGVKESVFGPISTYEFGVAGTTVTGQRFGDDGPTDGRYVEQSVVACVFPMIAGRQTLNDGTILSMDGWDNSTIRTFTASVATPTVLTLNDVHRAISGAGAAATSYPQVIITGSTAVGLTNGTYKIKTVISPTSFSLMTTGNVDVAVTVSGTGTASIEHANSPDTYQNDFLNINGLHRDGVAIDLGTMDHNRFHGIRLDRQSGGSGTGVLLRAFDDRSGAWSNDFHRVRPGTGGFVVQGTGTAANVPGADGVNRILAYDPDDGGVAVGLARAIRSVSVANPTHVTTKTRHLLATGQSVVIAGSDSTPTIDGTRTVTVLNDNVFTVAVNVTVAGTAVGTVTRKTFYDPPPPSIGTGADLIWYDRRDTHEPMVGPDFPVIATLPVQQSQFPNQADGGRRFFHTTKRMEFFYSHSSNWLSSTVYSENMTSATALTATGTAAYACSPFAGTGQWPWIEGVDIGFLVLGGGGFSALDGSNSWDVVLQYAVAESAAWVDIASWTIETGDSDVYRTATMAIALSPPRVPFPSAMWRVRCTKLGSPGDLLVQTRVNYRMLAFIDFPYWY